LGDSEKELYKWFHTITGIDGVIGAIDLQTSFKTHNLDFSIEVCVLLLKMHDEKKVGGVNIKEFLGLFKYIDNMKTTFQKSDKDGNGSLTLEEVQLLLNSLSLSKTTLENLFHKFDRKGNKSIDLGSFIELCVFVGLVKNVFGSFDQNKQGYITFDIDSFFNILTFVYH